MKNQKNTENEEEIEYIKPIIKRKEKRSIFSYAEDKLLEKLVQIHGKDNWSKISNYFPGKTIRQCKEHYKFSLDPNINRTPWTETEDKLLMQLYEKFGGKWVLIQKYMDHRTPDSIKNRVRSLTNYKPKRKLMKIEPSVSNE